MAEAVNTIEQSKRGGGDRSSRPAGAVGFVTSTTAMDLHRMFKPVVP
jgi:hypothetical protein